MRRYLRGIGAILVMLLMTLDVHADVYVAWPGDPTQAIYFPNLNTVLCFMDTAKLKKKEKKKPKNAKRSSASPVGSKSDSANVGT